MQVITQKESGSQRVVLWDLGNDPAVTLRYSVRSGPIVFRVRRGSPDTCRCSRKFYMEPTLAENFATEDAAREFFASLEPVARAAIGVVPDDTVTATGCRTGPFIPSSISYEVVNAGELPVSWTAFSSEAWLRVSPSSGTFLNPGERAVVEAVINTDSLCTGIHTAQISFTNQTNGLGNAVREIVLDVRGEPSPTIVPDEPFNTLGSLGGPFLPVFKDWTVANTDNCPMTFGITHTADWVSLSTETETLAAMDSVVVTATINAEANSLPPGRHEDRLIFRNLTSGREVFSRSVVLRVAI